MLNLLVILILSYLVGSIPSGMIIAKKFGNINIKQHGSGNVGGTNVFRVMGWKFGVSVIIFDALKGAIAVIFISRLYWGNFPFPNQTPFDDFTLIQIMAGITAVIGHVWTIFAQFKGGKGIATGLGVLITIITLDIALALAIFIIVVSFSKYISLGSISAAVSIPLIMIVRENIFKVDIQGYHTILPFVIALAVMIIYTHRSNIIRLLNGKENRISFSKNRK